MGRLLRVALLVQMTLFLQAALLSSKDGEAVAQGVESGSDGSSGLDATHEAQLEAAGASLGIGFDVFPRAYEFAAGRVGALSDLDMLGCKDERCNYNLGSGVVVSADHLPQSMDINRIEASLDARHSGEPAMRSQFEQACLAIVALVDPSASREEQRAAATAISAPSGPSAARFRLDSPYRSVRVYGMRMGGAATTPVALRCGAVAVR